MPDRNFGKTSGRSPPKERLSQVIWRILAIATFETIVVVALAITNPFDIVKSTETRSHDQWEQLVAANYEPPPLAKVAPGASRPFQKGDARDEITIVSINDDSLAAAGMKRPLVWSDHEAMFDSVADQPALVRFGKPPPKAIFIDLILANGAVKYPSQSIPKTEGDADQIIHACAAGPQPGQDRFQCYVAKVAKATRYWAWPRRTDCQTTPLQKIACIRQSGGIPVIFADPRTQASGLQTSTDPALSVLGQVAVLASAQVSTRDGYWLVWPHRHAERGKAVFMLSPAAALFAAYCTPEACEKSPLPAPGPIAPSRHDWPDEFDTPIDVAWGEGGRDAFTDMLDDHLTKKLEQRCQVPNSNFMGLVRRVTTQALTGLRDPTAPPPCPYTHAIPYPVLDSGTLTLEQLEDAVSGKVVLIGGEFADTNDFVATPFKHQLPGVYYHAMALDNLIQKQRAYPKAYPELTPLIINVGDLRNFVFVFIFSLMTSLSIITLNTIDNENHNQNSFAHLFRLDRVFVIMLYLFAIPLAAISAARLFPYWIQYYNLALIFTIWLVALPRIIISYLKYSLKFLMKVECVLQFLELRNIRWPDRRMPAPPPFPPSTNLGDSR